MKNSFSKQLLSTLGRNELPWQPIRRLGDASLKGFRVPYPGMNKVVQIAKQWIENYRSEQFIRDKALSITRGIIKNTRTGHADMRNFDAIAKSIHDFIVQEIMYVRDQNGVERLQTPDATLKLKSGDCDDMVILGGALLESVGVPTRIKLIGQKAGSFSHIFLEYESNNQWKSFDPTLALYPGYEFPKKLIAAEKTVPVNRPIKQLSTPTETNRGLSGFSDNNENLNSNNRTMGSGFVTEKDPQLGEANLDAEQLAKIGETAAGLFNKIGGLGKKESAADKNKQSVQKQIKNLGYPQFTKMKGWKGNEAQKLDAMQTILNAIQSNSGAASQINSWLEGGQVTPNTIAQVKSEYGSTGGSSAAITTATGGGINPMILIGGGSLLLLGLGYAATRKKKSTSK